METARVLPGEGVAWEGRGGGQGVITRKKSKEECFLYFFPLTLFIFLPVVFITHFPFSVQILD